MPDYETSVGDMLAMLEGYDGNEIRDPVNLDYAQNEAARRI
jgi:hypothetical protein